MFISRRTIGLRCNYFRQKASWASRLLVSSCHEIRVSDWLTFSDACVLDGAVDSTGLTITPLESSIFIFVLWEFFLSFHPSQQQIFHRR